MKRAGVRTADAMVRDLEATVGELRQRIEKVTHEAGAGVQEARLASENELRELKATIQSLREEMEKMRFEADSRVQAATAQSASEITQLKAAAQASEMRWTSSDSTPTAARRRRPPSMRTRCAS